MRVLGSRTGKVLVIGAGVLAVGAAGAFAASQYMERPTIEPKYPPPGGAVNTAKPRIVVDAGTSRLQDLAVTIDGRNVTDAVRGAGNTLVIAAPQRLREGRHVVAVRFKSDNLISRNVSRTWGFLVDTNAPRLDVVSPARDLSNRRAVRFTGKAEPRSTVRVEWPGGSVVTQATGRGVWGATARLPEGQVRTRVLAIDRAGNATAAPRPLLVDTIAPQVTLANAGQLRNLSSTDQPLIYGRVGNEDPTRLTFGATVNGVKVAPVRGADATTPSTDGSDPYTEAAVTTSGSSLQLSGRKFALGVGSLPQGRNKVTVWVRDAAGNVGKRTFTAFVDTSSEFGTHQMVAGAKGDDVKALQQRLKDTGLFKGKITGVYDARTTAAVRRYQKRHDLSVTGNIGQATLHAMIGRIVVHLNSYSLTLYRDGKAVKTYSIAIGQSAYPTPTGHYEVVNMQVDPTWIPPDSPWAAGLGPIPPGPGNPLGTRWIGTSAPGVGIHGTYADWSVGTAASHGCLRMHISDVEDLYTRVAVGMPVDIEN